MRTQLFDLDEAKGKTINGIIEAWDRMIIWFADNSFLYITSSYKQYDECTQLNYAERFDLLDFPTQDMLQSGFVTQEEIDILRESRNQARMKREEELERARYAQLKAKFEPQ